jgi:hypothetical protein
MRDKLIPFPPPETEVESSQVIFEIGERRFAIDVTPGSIAKQRRGDPVIPIHKGSHRKKRPKLAADPSHV